MIVVRLASPTDFDGWRNAARQLLRDGVAPDAVDWVAGEASSLFAAPASADPVPASAAGATPRVPAEFIRLARDVILHREPQRFALLHRLLVRLIEEPRLLDVASDEDVARARLMQKAIDRDIHKMHAFVRFRETTMDDGLVYVAWFEPAHYIVEAAAPFFVRRFASMRWSILTPDASAYWDGATLRFGPGATRADAPNGDALEAQWRTYYASIFNPARLKTHSMQAHMPKKYWHNLPEAQLIPSLIEAATQRTGEMIVAAPAQPARRIIPYAPPQREAAPADALSALREAARDCRNCPLWEHATQTVFGEGPADARVLFVGEQPGDREDLAGRPFVGPAGKLFDRALAAAGIDRGTVYITNAVKHFKFEVRGRRRLHRTPRQAEIDACVDWFERELATVNPRLVVCMGGTALHAVTGRMDRVGDVRGRIRPWNDDRLLLVTVHPSALLRADPSVQAEETARFFAEIALVAPFTGSA